jgi:hypothetical protein
MIIFEDDKKKIEILNYDEVDLIKPPFSCKVQYIAKEINYKEIYNISFDFKYVWDWIFNNLQGLPTSKIESKLKEIFFKYEGLQHIRKEIDKEWRLL